MEAEAVAVAEQRQWQRQRQRGSLVVPAFFLTFFCFFFSPLYIFFQLFSQGAAVRQVSAYFRHARAASSAEYACQGCRDEGG